MATVTRIQDYRFKRLRLRNPIWPYDGIKELSKIYPGEASLSIDAGALVAEDELHIIDQYFQAAYPSLHHHGRIGQPHVISTDLQLAESVEGVNALRRYPVIAGVLEDLPSATS